MYNLDLFLSVLSRQNFNGMTINMNNGKKLKDIRHTEKELIVISIFFTKDYDYKCIGLITTTCISKHDIRNRKLIAFE